MLGGSACVVGMLFRTVRASRRVEKRLRLQDKPSNGSGIPGGRCIDRANKLHEIRT